MTNYGPDGHGPPPSPEVMRATAPFFSDQPPPVDPDVVERISRQIRDREAATAWNRRKNT